MADEKRYMEIDYQTWLRQVGNSKDDHNERRTYLATADYIEELDSQAESALIELEYYAGERGACECSGNGSDPHCGVCVARVILGSPTLDVKNPRELESRPAVPQAVRDEENNDAD